MAEIWAVALTTAATVGTAAYNANQQKKAAAQALENQKQNALPEFKRTALPQFIPVKFGDVNNSAITADEAAYLRSDADFARRNPELVKANKMFKSSVLKDQEGDSELMPQVQNEFMRAGLAEALASFGGTEDTSTLAPGSAGEASVARNLGVGILNLQDRNRRNRNESLSIAARLFPKRQIGLTGSDAASIEIANTNQTNATLQAEYEAEVAAKNKNYDINAQNTNSMVQAENAAAAANAEANAELMKAYAGAATGAVGAASRATAGASTSKLAGTTSGATMKGATGYLAGYTATGAPIVKKA